MRRLVRYFLDRLGKRPEPEREQIWIVRCERCGGILYASDSMARGLGPGCWHKMRAENPYAQREREGQIPMFPELAAILEPEEDRLNVPM